MQMQVPVTGPPPLTVDMAIAATRQQEMQRMLDDAVGHFTITPSNPREIVGVLGLEYLCVDFAATNAGTMEATPIGDFTAVRPSGTVALSDSVVLPDGQVVSGFFATVVPDAVTTATQCFPTDGERGTFTVRYGPVNGEDGPSWLIDVM